MEEGLSHIIVLKLTVFRLNNYWLSYVYLYTGMSCASVLFIQSLKILKIVHENYVYQVTYWMTII